MYRLCPNGSRSYWRCCSIAALQRYEIPLCVFKYAPSIECSLQLRHPGLLLSSNIPAELRQVTTFIIQGISNLLSHVVEPVTLLDVSAFDDYRNEFSDCCKRRERHRKVPITYSVRVSFTISERIFACPLIPAYVFPGLVPCTDRCPQERSTVVEVSVDSGLAVRK